MIALPAPESQPRVLGVYAHPDDETFCTGGTFARYAAVGCDIWSSARREVRLGRSGPRTWRREKPWPRFASRSCVWRVRDWVPNKSSAGMAKPRAHLVGQTADA